MGSTPSTPTNEGSNDPWWSIENQNLDLNPTPAANSASMENSRDVVEGDSHHRQQQQQQQQQIVENQVQSIESDTNNSSEPKSVLEKEGDSTSSDELDNGTGVVASTPHSHEDEAKNSDTVNGNHRQTLEEFKEELRIKREKRKCAIAELRNEILSLRKQLEHEKMLNRSLMTTNGTRVDQIDNSADASECQPCEQSDRNIILRTQLAEAQFDLQKANAENSMLSQELAATKQKTQSLKDIIAACKEIISVRETELTQLKGKFKEIEDSLADREVQLMSKNLRQEYERQFENMRHLKTLYDERTRLAAAEKENFKRKLETSESKLADEVEKNKNLEEHISSLDVELKTNTIDLYAAREQLSYYKSEHQKLGDEMTGINQLFSQLLSGFNGSNDIDIDTLTTMLEENRDLLNDMTSREHCKEGAAQIPKLMLDLFAQANNTPTKAPEEIDEAAGSSTEGASSGNATVSSAVEISNNLPKVWKVLIELLNHQQLKPVQIMETNAESTDCYKSIETPNGPKMVLSVSKTYLRLKDLILEKKFLQKETKKLKNLNSHLETKLDEQETRLTAVTIELNKTWTLVGRMQRQHRQLHTSEQVLRYQLQQKRRMLNELKDELEYCRRKWTLAKEKNSVTQSQWESLRLEFIKRKECDANNSAESGYSDSPLTDDDDEEPNNDNALDAKQETVNGNSDQSIENDHKTQRLQSSSPVRRTKLHVARRNSDSHIAQFATEVFQVQTDVVQPINNTCELCDGNCTIHSVHFDDQTTKNDEIRITEAIVVDASDAVKANVLNTPCGTKSKIKVTKTNTTKARSSKTGTKEESLEDMFMRISGLQPETAPCQSDEETQDSSDDEDCHSSTQEHENDIVSHEHAIASNECVPYPAQISTEPIFDDPSQPSTSYAKTEQYQASTSNINRNTTNEPQPSTSQAENVTNDETACLSDIEKAYTERRNDRLKRLEDESNAFLEKMRNRNDRASQMQNKLQLLHERYGSEKISNVVESQGTSDECVEEAQVEHSEEQADNGDQSEHDEQ